MKSRLIGWKAKLIYSLLIIMAFVPHAHSQGMTTQTSSLLSDLNGNGIISIVAIGDSLTSGLGDIFLPGADVPELFGTEFGEGYPGRLSRYLGVPVENEGIPGEELLLGGVARFPSELNTSQADTAILFEGLNDAVFRANPPELGRAVQRAVNVARASNRNIVLVTLPPPCCNRAGRESFVFAYSQEMRNVAAANSVALADVAKAWDTSCKDPVECELFNLPEGLHPNKAGYDVIAQTIAASILNIDIFAPDGATLLAAAIGVPVGDIKVKPAAISPVPVN